MFYPIETPEHQPYRRAIGNRFLGFCSPPVRDFYRYWDAKRGDRMAPSRADIDPIEMKSWLTGIVLVDVSEPPRTLTYRLVGSRSVALKGRDTTGEEVARSYHGRSRDEIWENYRIAIEDVAPVYDYEPEVSASGVLKDSETLLLPLASDGIHVNMVLVYLVLERVEDTDYNRSKRTAHDIVRI